MTTLDLASGETASKYHQSHEEVFIADNCGPSKLHVDSKFAVMSPVTVVAGIVFDWDIIFALGLRKAFDAEHVSPARIHGMMENLILPIKSKARK